MKILLTTAHAGAALLGAVALAGSAVSVRAADTVSKSFAHVEGIVANATDSSLEIHPPVGDNVTVTLANTTQIHFVTDRPEGPEGPNEAKSAQEVTPVPPPPPSPTTFVGLFARAEYDKTTLVAAGVLLSKPFPLPAFGLVHDSAANGFTLDLPDGRQLKLVVGTSTELRLDGKPAASSDLSQGDRAEVLFNLTATENDALKVRAAMTPPRTFEGVVGVVTLPNTFTVLGGGVTQTFKVDSNTAVRINDQKASLSDLVANQPVHVLYRARNGAMWALRVSARKLKGIEPKKGKDKPKPPHREGFEGVVASVGTDSTFVVNHGEKSLTFKVDDKTAFRMNDKPATFADLKADEHVYVQFLSDNNLALRVGIVLPKKPEARGSDSGKPKEKKEKPRPPQLGGFEGTVASVNADNSTFVVNHGDKSLTFKVDAKTIFRLRDKPAAFSDLKSDLHVYVQYVGLTDGNVALRVGIVPVKGVK